MALTQAQVNDYRRDGFIVVPGLLDPAALTTLREIIAGLVCDAAEVDTHTDVYDLEPGHTRAAPRVRRIKTPHKVHPAFDAIPRSPAVLSVLHALLGPGLRLHGSKLNMKSAQFGSPVEWHQDWAFYPHTNDDLLAIGVLLDDMTLANGPLLVVPGSHTGPTYNHHGADGRFCGAINPADVAGAAERAVPLTGAAGSMSFHHVRALHGSALNTSDRSRNLLLFEVAASDAWPLVGVSDLAAFDGLLLSGPPTIEPRIVPTPVRMPLPPPSRQGSIYEIQASVTNSYFARPEAA